MHIGCVDVMQTMVLSWVLTARACASTMLGSYASMASQVLASSAQGNTEQLCRVTDARPDAIYARSRFGYTAAHLAAWGGHVSTLAVLMHLDSSILRAMDVFGQSACHFAAWTGRLALHLLVQVGASTFH